MPLVEARMSVETTGLAILLLRGRWRLAFDVMIIESNDRRSRLLDGASRDVDHRPAVIRAELPGLRELLG